MHTSQITSTACSSVHLLNAQCHAYSITGQGVGPGREEDLVNIGVSPLQVPLRRQLVDEVAQLQGELAEGLRGRPGGGCRRGMLLVGRPWGPIRPASQGAALRSCSRAPAMQCIVIALLLFPTMSSALSPESPEQQEEGVRINQLPSS